MDGHPELIAAALYFRLAFELHWNASMKRQARKLSIQKETLRNLTGEELAGVAGAWINKCSGPGTACSATVGAVRRTTVWIDPFTNQCPHTSE